MSDGHRRLEEAADVAAAKGCVIVHPKRNELFIDIDSIEAWNNFQKCFEVLTKTEAATISTRTRSPSGKLHREHIVIKMPRDVTDEERILLQACLASDPLREMLSLMRLRAGDEAPTIFFEKKKTSKSKPTNDVDDDIAF